MHRIDFITDDIRLEALEKNRHICSSCFKKCAGEFEVVTYKDIKAGEMPRMNDLYIMHPKCYSRIYRGDIFTRTLSKMNIKVIIFIIGFGCIIYGLHKLYTNRHLPMQDLLNYALIVLFGLLILSVLRTSWIHKHRIHNRRTPLAMRLRVKQAKMQEKDRLRKYKILEHIQKKDL